MATTCISLQCNSLSQIRTFKCLLQAEISMIGRAYMDTSLAKIH